MDMLMTNDDEVIARECVAIKQCIELFILVIERWHAHAHAHAHASWHLA
jgi:hypothetical protein